MFALLIILAVAVYLTAAFATGHTALRRGLAKHDSYQYKSNCVCDGDRDGHYFGAMFCGIGFPIYGCYRLGLFLSQFNYSEWQETRLQEQHKKSLAAVHRQTEIAKANQELLVQQLGPNASHLMID